jgi:hypothetical protein
MGMNMIDSITRAFVRPYRLQKPPSKRVAIVVPLSARKELLPEEEVSMRHLLRFLGSYDKFLVLPKGLGFRHDSFTTIEFSPKFFGSALAYNRLMYSPRLYELFEDYKFILMYHLDSLVFSDELPAWCDMDVDFIGAPWIECPDCPWVTEPCVGNGGFALMKVENILRVLSNRYQANPRSYWKDLLSRNFSLYSQPTESSAAGPEPRGLAGGVQKAWDKIRSSETNRVNNDVFWGYHAKKYLPEFRVPDWKTALRFAFEVSPRICFELNGHKLPFGCHAWAKYDRGFWEPYLLSESENS